MTSIHTAVPPPPRRATGGIVRSLPAWLLASALAGALCATGCQSPQSEPKAAAPPSPDRAAAIRASIEQAQPGSLVGRVIKTLDERPYAAVAEIPVQDVAVGETITFVDGNANPITSGTVIDKSPEALFVNYQPGKRRVEQGDLAVWFRSGPGPTTAPTAQTARP
jgi:hypothetical protein